MPTPVWDSAIRCWHPVDFRLGQQVTQWPEGFDAARLPVPEYDEGDRVQFVRDETCAREGSIRLILFQFVTDAASSNNTQLDPCHITYVVTARGHDHRVKARDILGQFVSSVHMTRVIPIQE